mgnify:CR=1 FL=1
MAEISLKNLTIEFGTFKAVAQMGLPNYIQSAASLP